MKRRNDLRLSPGGALVLLGAALLGLGVACCVESSRARRLPPPAPAPMPDPPRRSMLRMEQIMWEPPRGRRVSLPVEDFLALQRDLHDDPWAITAPESS